MSKIESAKTYTGRDLETIFFRPIMTGPEADALGIRVMYNMPAPTALQFWRRSGDVLQQYGGAGWNGGSVADKYQKFIEMYKVKAEMGYSAQDYFASIFEVITGRSDVNMDDLTGTELEEAETALFRQAIAESIRMTMWLGDRDRGTSYTTFDGFLKRLVTDITDGEKGMCTGMYEPLSAPEDAEKLLKKAWDKASPQLRAAKSEGKLAYFVTSDIYAAYEEALDNVQLDAAYLARQEGRKGLSFRGIPVIDIQLGEVTLTDLPVSFALLTDRRNLALAVNTADFPGTEVRMWYNPDEMQNRQRAIFMAGADYLLPELVSMVVKQSDMTFDKSAVTATGGAVKVTVANSVKMIESIKACGLTAADAVAGSEITMTKLMLNYNGTIAGTNIAKVRFVVKYRNGESFTFVK